jgi:hypothetical protein
MVGLIITAVVVVAAVVAYKLWKSGKAVTGGNIVAGVEADAKAVANTVKSDVANTSVKL